MSKFNFDEWKIKANEKFNNKFEYISFNKKNRKIIYICPIHGQKEQIIYHHMSSKYGCPSCGNSALVKPLEEVLELMVETHKDEYIYGGRFKETYKSIDRPAVITCKIHGEFEQNVRTHIAGSRCPECVREERLVPLEERIKQFESIHKDEEGLPKYIYDDEFKQSYKTIHDKASFNCPKHGRFIQIVHNHIRGSGCPSCALENNTSQVELDLRELFSTYPDVVFNYRPYWMNGYELDIYIPSLKLAIEYNGVLYHHSSENYFTPPKEDTYHLMKYELCSSKGVDLIHVFEFENIESWKALLKAYLEQPSCFKILFTNERREYKDLTYYGKSELLLL